jgi:hypothetical protein
MSADPLSLTYLPAFPESRDRCRPDVLPDSDFTPSHLRLPLTQAHHTRVRGACRRYLGRRAAHLAKEPSPEDTPPPSPPRLDSVASLSPKEVGDLLSRISARSAWRRAVVTLSYPADLTALIPCSASRLSLNPAYSKCASSCGFMHASAVHDWIGSSSECSLHDAATACAAAVLQPVSRPGAW